MDVNIGHQHTPANGEFFAEQEGHKIGHLDYRKHGNVEIIIDNVEVDAKERLHGVGTQLVRQAANYARENKLILKSHCSFARRVLEKSPEFKDVYLRAA